MRITCLPLIFGFTLSIAGAAEVTQPLASPEDPNLQLVTSLVASPDQASSGTPNLSSPGKSVIRLKMSSARTTPSTGKPYLVVVNDNPGGQLDFTPRTERLDDAVSIPGLVAPETLALEYCSLEDSADPADQPDLMELLAFDVPTVSKYPQDGQNLDLFHLTAKRANTEPVFPSFLKDPEKVQEEIMAMKAPGGSASGERHNAEVKRIELPSKPEPIGPDEFRNLKSFTISGARLGPAKKTAAPPPRREPNRSWETPLF
ncbi:MAG: hypothetical protein LBU79_03885 [Planctomycetota bacterium]|jgi:hypothetical protein|nr:hypothetical protein [Planctomycetota bacterium]